MWLPFLSPPLTRYLTEARNAANSKLHSLPFSPILSSHLTFTWLAPSLFPITPLPSHLKTFLPRLRCPKSSLFVVVTLHHLHFHFSCRTVEQHS
jgi:hypothetical protein